MDYSELKIAHVTYMRLKNLFIKINIYFIINNLKL